MARPVPRLALAALVSLCVLYGQPGDPRPEFEAAVVKVTQGSAPPGAWTATGGPGTPDPGHFTARSIPLFDLIVRAYGLNRYQIIAPEWLNTARFDLAAKLPEGTTREGLASMLQRLLEERLRVAVHKDRREMPVYQMTVAKGGPKFQEWVPDAASAEDRKAPPPHPSPRDRALDGDGYPVLADRQVSDRAVVRGRISQRMVGAGMDRLTALLALQLDRPVIDRTELHAKYNFSLHYVLDSLALRGDGPSLAEAVQSQLGLKLESKREMVDVLIVDHAEKIPAGN